MIFKIMFLKMMVSLNIFYVQFRYQIILKFIKYFNVFFILNYNLFLSINYLLNFIAVIFFTNMLGKEEDGLVNHITEFEITERGSGKKLVELGLPAKYKSYMELFKEKLALNKPKKGKKGKKGKKKKKK